MPRVLFISLKFPPLSDIGAKRALRFVRRLPDHGWQPTVLTLPIPAPAQCDASLLGLVPGDLVVSRTYARGAAFSLIDRVKERWSRSVGRVVGARSRADAPPASVWRDLVYRAEDFAESLVVCDEWLPFVASGYRAGLDLLERNRHEAIYVCGDPNSAYLTGWMLARTSGLPLILDLRDPWTLDPTIRRLKSWPALLVEEALERRVFAASSRIILNTERARALHVARFGGIPAERFATIHNAFDAELFGLARERPAPDAPLTVAHFGNYHRLRSARVFLEALAQVAETRPVRFVNYGEVRPDDLAHADRLGLREAIDLPGYVHYRDAARVLSRAHVLLLEQRNDESVQIPGKFYDYLLARRPILSLSRNPELADALGASQAGEEVDPSSPAAVARALTRLAATDLDAFEARLDAGAVRRFSATETTRALAEILDDVTGRRRGVTAQEARGERDGLDADDRLQVAGMNGKSHQPRVLDAPRGKLRVGARQRDAQARAAGEGHDRRARACAGVEVPQVGARLVPREPGVGERDVEARGRQPRRCDEADDGAPQRVDELTADGAQHLRALGEILAQAFAFTPREQRGADAIHHRARRPHREVVVTVLRDLVAGRGALAQPAHRRGVAPHRRPSVVLRDGQERGARDPGRPQRVAQTLTRGERARRDVVHRDQHGHERTSSS